MTLKSPILNNYDTMVFGYGDVVKKKYFQDIPKEQWERIVFVESKIIADSADRILMWDTPELDQFIEQHVIRNFIVATTPGSHGPILDYLHSFVGSTHAQIFVEKPFLPSSALFNDSYTPQYESGQSLSVLCIDHYLAKPVVRWLKSNISHLVERHGNVRRLEFTSYETKSFSNIETFKVGYAIEHGVHALPCFEYILGPLFETFDQVAVKNSQVELHEMDSEKFINKFDFEFTVVTKLGDDSANCSPLELCIKGGKLQQAVQKSIQIEFENGFVNCGLNTNEVIVNHKPVEVSLSNQSAYEYIFQKIFESDLDKSLLLEPEQAMKSVALMELGAETAEIAHYP